MDIATSWLNKERKKKPVQQALALGFVVEHGLDSMRV
jgi:hypothetical protein